MPTRALVCAQNFDVAWSERIDHFVVAQTRSYAKITAMPGGVVARMIYKGARMAPEYKLSRIALRWEQDSRLGQRTIRERLEAYCRKVGREKPYRLTHREAISALSGDGWHNWPPQTLT